MPEILPAKSEGLPKKKYTKLDIYSTVFSSYMVAKEDKSYIESPVKNIERVPIERIPFKIISIGNFDFSINSALTGIAASIEESKSLMNAENISDGGDPLDFDAYINAIMFLCDYSNAIYNGTSPRKTLSTPYIDLTMTGDVYLDWKTDKANFLIIFKKDKDISYFYGETKEDKIPFKSAIHNKSIVKDFLLDWFKENLCV